MSNPFLPVVFFSLLVAGYTTFAEKLNSDEQRISLSTGAIFTRDNSNPKLGEAYRDPSGLIWGATVTVRGAPNYINPIDPKYKRQYDAMAVAEDCKNIGARLPTMEEFEQLAKYLGLGSPKGYSPYQLDAKTEVLTGLYRQWFWSSTGYPGYEDYAFGFISETGRIGFAVRTDSFAARCVSK